MPHGRPDPIPFYADRFPEREAAALAAVSVIDNAVLDSTTVTALVDSIMDDHAASPVLPIWDELHFTTHDQPPAEPGGSPRVQLTFVLPCRGAAMLFFSSEPQVVSSGQGGGGSPDYLLNYSMEFSLAGQPDQESFTSAIGTTRDAWLSSLRAAIDRVNVKIEDHRSRLRDEVEQLVRQRHSLRALITGAASSLDIPLDRRRSAHIPIPIAPQALDLNTVESAAAAGRDEHGLAADIADALVEQIYAFSLALERSPSTSNRLIGEDEESIRDVLLFVLNANWKGTAMAETFLGEGKTDILLRWRDRDAFIGECKIWRGEKYFTEGLSQLLDRYTVWRATRIAMVIFFRDSRAVTDLLDKAYASVQAHERYVGETSTSSAGLRSFTMRAQSDQKQMITLTVVPVVIPRP